MASVSAGVATDCSVVAKWKLSGEPQATEAEELLLDWLHLTVEVIAPSLLVSEILSAFLKAFRRGRISEAETITYIQDLLHLPFNLHEITEPLVLKAFQLAKNYNQRSFDCLYVALAEQEAVEFWTGDQRLFNALHQQLPFVRWIGDYKRKRP
jgi:predicted nucleic acid-binding protein